MKCALVTGGSGYIGSRLVRGLIVDGWQVHVVLRPSSSLNQLEPYIDRITVHRHQGTVGDMLGIVSTAKPDVVFHLAAMATSDHSPEHVDQMVIGNVLYSTQLIEGMARNGVKNLVNTETFWQFGEGSGGYDPVCLYAATKQAFHDILAYYVKIGAINAISLVLFDTYGPGDPRNKLFSFLKRAVRENLTVEMTPGEQYVDMTHVDDVVDAYLRAADILLNGNGGRLDRYAVTSGRRMRLKELVELAARESGLSIHPNWGGKEYRTYEVMAPWLGEPLPGWHPKITLEVGIWEVFSDL